MRAAQLSPIVREYVETGRCKTCPIIDMHGHMGPFYGAYFPSADVDRMRRSLARAGVERIVCSSHDALMVDSYIGNCEMQQAIAQYPDQFSGYWVVNPNHQDILARVIDDFENSIGFVGFKVLPDYHKYPLDGDAYSPIWEYADAKSLIVLSHTWGGSTFDSPQHVERVASKYPNVRIIMGHSGYGDWETSVRVARDYPNVYLELTAVYIAHDFSMNPTGSGTPLALASCLQVNGIIEYMVENASSKKIIYGTDMPWHSPLFAAGAVLFADIDDEARKDILHRNAKLLLKKES